MILSNSSAAYIGANTNNVSAIASTSTDFRFFHIYDGEFPYNRPISGTTGLVKTGNGNLATGQIFNYTGPTQINGGKIKLSSASSLNGVISGSGGLYIGGQFQVVIRGNNTYSGGTEYLSSGPAASIVITNGTAFGTGTITCTNQTQIITANAITIPNNFVINNSSLQFRTTGAPTFSVSGNISGAGGLYKTGNGTTNLDGNLSYTGSTSITGGFLRAKKINGTSTATARFQSSNLSLSVSFDVSPPSGTTTNFQFFQGTTIQTYIPTTISLSGVPVNTTATYDSTTSTLSVIVP